MQRLPPTAIIAASYRNNIYIFKECVKIAQCEFYNNCKYAKPEAVCMSGGGKYCGTWRTKRYEKKAKSITDYFT